jgi:hypothetical protein
LQQPGRTHKEQQWLEFILALLRWKCRFDVELSEAPQNIPGGEFDIEIET